MKCHSLIRAALTVACLGCTQAPFAWADEISLSVSNISNRPDGTTTFTLTWFPLSDGSPVRALREYHGNTQTLSLNATPPVTLTRGRGTYMYWVEFGYPINPAQMFVTSRSNPVTVNVPTPVTPTLFDPLRPPLDHGFRLQWSGDPGTFIYELVEDTRPDFSTPTTPNYWPSVNFEPIPPKAPGTYYYRVRAWNQLPENGGVASGWSNVVTVQVQSDQQFLDLLGRKTFDYLLATTWPNGLTQDRFPTNHSPTDVASIAATGFYLSGLTVGAARGWIDSTDAAARARTTLTTLLNGTPNVHGFFYHFLRPDGAPSDIPFLEVSSIDTALLLAGALQAGEYFGGEVKTLAETIYRRVDWTWMFDPTVNLMRWGWIDEARGFYQGGYYDSHSEALLLYLLAIGSPTHPIPAEAFYGFARPKGGYRGPDFIFTAGGQLFTYQYAQAWYDFRNTTDALGVNWWQNAVEAVRANQRFAIDHPDDGYSQDVWGITSCDGPYPTPQNPNGYQGYGAQPAYTNVHDGTIAPTGIGGSIALAPDIALPSLKHLYTVHGDQLWNSYGFVDSFNPKLGWVDTYYIGIDQGIILLMLENARSGFIWQTFMQNAHVRRSLARAKFSGHVPPDITLEDFEDGNFWTPETTVGWWDSAGTNVYRRFNESSTVAEGSVAMRIEYSKNGDAYSLMGAHVAPANPRRDFSGYDRVTLAAAGRGTLLVKLRDQAQAEQEVALRAVRSGPAWTRLVFDFPTPSLDASAIDNVLLFVDPGNGTSQGTLFLDNVRLESRRPIVLEDFEDGNFWTPETTVGWWDIDGARVYRRALSKDPSRGGLGAMRVEYAKDGLPWSLFGAFLSPSNPRRDFTSRTRLGVAVFGEGEVLVKLRDRALREVELARARATNPRGWTRLTFDYAGVEGIDLRDIDNVLFFLEPGNPSAAGTVYLDDLVLE